MRLLNIIIEHIENWTLDWFLTGSSTLGKLEGGVLKFMKSKIIEIYTPS